MIKGVNMTKRTDRLPGHRGAFEKNKKRILATQKLCGICGGEVDFNLAPSLLS